MVKEIRNISVVIFSVVLLNSCSISPEINKEGEEIIRQFQKEFECSISLMEGDAIFVDSSSVWKYVSKNPEKRIYYPAVRIEIADENVKMDFKSEESVNLLTNEFVNSLYPCFTNKSKCEGLMVIYVINRGDSFDSISERRMLYLLNEERAPFLYQITSW